MTSSSSEHGKKLLQCHFPPLMFYRKWYIITQQPFAMADSSHRPRCVHPKYLAIQGADKTTNFDVLLWCNQPVLMIYCKVLILKFMICNDCYIFLWNNLMVYLYTSLQIKLKISHILYKISNNCMIALKFKTYK